MATTQDDRLMRISTPLGKDYLLINRFTAHEGLSKLFQFDIELLHEENEVSFSPTTVDAHQLIGQGVTIHISAIDGSKREFTGMVNKFSQGNRDVRFSYYYISVVPFVWLLTQQSQSRIFQQMSVPDILRKVFDGFQVKYELQENYEERNYCVQYRETDFDFASRLMEEEGIFYFFEHKNGQHELIIADTPQSHRDCPGKSKIPFFVSVGSEEDFVGSVSTFLNDWQLQTGKVTLWDYNFQLPTNRLNLEQPSRFSFGESQKLEHYDYPGGYARKYDGIDKGGGEQSGELTKVFNDRQSTVKKMMESYDARVTTATGRSDCCSITAGYRFSLENHPNAEANKQYTILTATHEAEQNPSYVSNEGATDPYTNSFTCILHGAGAPTFRPLRQTPKPIVQGGQTAIVVGPGGEEIFTDMYGRVKVQFYWDREGKVNEASSCWVRVAQTWAGNNWGTMFIPRVGMEVLVNFLEGDPDQPIITGCVYNPQTMPPYKLPDEKTKSTIKSSSSTGGSGFNEFRFEDKAGEEQIFIHAEKNEDIRVKNDCMEWIGRDRHLIVKRDQIEKVERNKDLLVKSDQTEKVDGNVHLKVGSNKEQKIGSKFAVDSGTEIHLKAGMSTVIEAGSSLTLKVGGNFVNINPAGVFVSGTMVMLNSGGAAGSGSGASPGTPKDPLEADKAGSGSKVKPPPAPPPTQKELAEQARIQAEEEAKKKADAEYLKSLPVPPDHEIIEALKDGVGDIFKARPVNIPAVEKRLNERDYKALLDAAQFVPSPQGGRIKDPFEATRILTKALDAAKKDAGIAVAPKFDFGSVLAGPAIPSQPVAPPPAAAPTNYRPYKHEGEEEAEEKDVKPPEALPTNYTAYKHDVGEAAEQKDVKPPEALPTNYTVYEHDVGEAAEQKEEAIGGQANSMITAAGEGTAYVTYTGS